MIDGNLNSIDMKVFIQNVKIDSSPNWDPDT